MSNIPEQELQKLCEHLQINPEFFEQCLQESVVEIHEIDGHFDLGNGTVLRLRRLERICTTHNVDLSIALHILKLNQRIEELEEKLCLLGIRG